MIVGWVGGCITCTRYMVRAKYARRRVCSGRTCTLKGVGPSDPHQNLVVWRPSRKIWGNLLFVKEVESGSPDMFIFAYEYVYTAAPFLAYSHYLARRFCIRYVPPVELHPMSRRGGANCVHGSEVGSVAPIAVSQGEGGRWECLAKFSFRAWCFGVKLYFFRRS